MTKYIYYAGYGSNLDKEHMKERLGKEVELVGPGVIEDHILLFDKPSVKSGTLASDIAPKEGSRVYVMVYKVPKELMEKLSKSEGFPVHYTMKNVKVKLADGRVVEAVVYVAQPFFTTEAIEKSAAELMDEGYPAEKLKGWWKGAPSSEYLTYFIKGSKHMPKEWAKDLQRYLRKKFGEIFDEAYRLVHK